LPELPVVSGAEVFRALERLGFRVVRQAEVDADEFMNTLT